MQIFTSLAQNPSASFAAIAINGYSGANCGDFDPEQRTAPASLTAPGNAPKPLAGRARERVNGFQAFSRRG